jgi:hypothetical protein
MDQMKRGLASTAVAVGSGFELRYRRLLAYCGSPELQSHFYESPRSHGRRAILAALLLPLGAFAETAAVLTDPPAAPLAPEAALKTFHVEDGYRLEPVLTEPQIEEPVVAAFDGNGRMFVAEMRTYMQKLDDKDQMQPLSRVSMHVDTDGDGKFDKHTAFIDKLVLPRMILPLDDRLIVCETNTLDFYSYRDTDGDGIADEKKLFYAGGPRGGNLEHQPSGLIWALDNWMYITTDPFRLRLTPTGVVKDATANNGGQWGLTQDDYGKLWFTTPEANAAR